MKVTGWPARGDALMVKDTLAGCWSGTTVTDPTMLFGGPKWMAQWKAYVPGWVKWVNVADVPVAVDPEGVPLSHTSGWLAKGPVKVTLSPVLIIGFADIYEYMPGPPFGKLIGHLTGGSRTGQREADPQDE